MPARGGSKGVKGKNIRPLAGKPLINHTIEAALGFKSEEFRLWVSTDSSEIASIAQAAGAEAPFLRPPEFAKDETPSIEVVQHALRFLRDTENTIPDYLLLLQPTSPLRTDSDIAEVRRLFVENPSINSVVSVRLANDVHPHKAFFIENGNLQKFFPNSTEGVRRQDYRPLSYMTNGAIYCSRTDVILTHGRLLDEKVTPYVMSDETSLDIDTELDFFLAEKLLDKWNKSREGTDER